MISQETTRCHTYSLGSSVLLSGASVVVAATPPGDGLDGWRPVPVLRKTPLTLANTLTMPFLSLSAFGTGSAGWAEELMMLLSGNGSGLSQWVNTWLGRGLKKKGFVRNPTGW